MSTFNIDTILFANTQYKQGDVFPFVPLPPLSEIGGEEQGLSDFQWWSYTSDWDNWLKKNPTKWKAESLTQDYGSLGLFEEFIGEDERIVLDFSDFDQLLENKGAQDEEGKKRMTKLIFTWNRLNKDGKIQREVDLKNLTLNTEYGFWLDMPDLATGKDNTESRDCYNLRVTGSLGKYLIMESSEGSLFTPATDEKTPFPKWAASAERMGNFLQSGAGQAVLMYLGASLAIKTLDWGTGGSITKLRTALSKWIPRLAKKAPKKPGWNLGTLWRSGKYVFSSLGGIRPFLLGSKYGASGKLLKTANKGFIRNLTKGFNKAIKAGKMAVKGTRVASGAVKASNPIGWAIAAVGAIQQTWNWFGKEQAPRYGEIEEQGWAHSVFDPSSIKPGQSITICWTQEAGQNSVLGFVASMVVDNDTRTVMNLYKIGKYEGTGGESLEMFALTGVVSESMNKILSENDLIIISFPSGKKYGHGDLDNDDMDVIVSKIPAGTFEKISQDFFFWGYCDWATAKSTFDSSPDKFLNVPESAPDNYEFNFKYGPNSYDMNVKGRLIPQSEVDTIEGMESIFNSFGGSTKTETSSEEKNESFSLGSSADVMSFNQYHALKESLIAEGTETGDGPDEDNSEPPAEVEDRFDEELTEPAPISAYVVEEVYYADNNLSGLTKPELTTFVVSSSSLKADVGQSISVGTVQDVDFKNAKRGIIDVESEIIPGPEVASGESTDGENQTAGGEGGVPVTITKAEAIRRYEDYPEILNKMGIKDRDKLKDKDLEDKKVVILDAFTPEEKEELELSDWEDIKKVMVTRDSETKEPLRIKFVGRDGSGNRKKTSFKASDPRFTTAQKVADRVLSVQYQSPDEEPDQEDGEDED